MYTQPRYLSLQRPRLFANSWLQSNFQPGLNFPHNDIILGDIPRSIRRALSFNELANLLEKPKLKFNNFESKFN